MNRIVILLLFLAMLPLLVFSESAAALWRPYNYKGSPPRKPSPENTPFVLVPTTVL
nr:hypothetical protein [Clostridia bacterium]